jgi:hypothetical protein
MPSKPRVLDRGATGRNMGAATTPADPGARSGILAGASFVAGVVAAMILSDAPYPRPGSEPADVRRYFEGNPAAARISTVGQLVSAVSLARFSVSVAKLAARSARRSQGLRTAALAGGGLAAASLATSALLSAALTGRRGEQDDSAAALHRLMFAAGGPVHGAGFGALVGSLGLAGLSTGELPQPGSAAARVDVHEAMVETAAQVPASRDHQPRRSHGDRGPLRRPTMGDGLLPEGITPSGPNARSAG